MHISTEAKAYKEMVADLLFVNKVKPLDGPIAVTIAWYRARKSGDLDKRLGVVLDAMQGGAYNNDSQIVYLEAERHDEHSYGSGIIVTVKPAIIVDV